MVVERSLLTVKHSRHWVSTIGASCLLIGIVVTGCSPGTSSRSAPSTLSATTTSIAHLLCGVFPSLEIKVTDQRVCSLTTHVGGVFHLSLAGSLRWSRLTVSRKSVVRVISVSRPVTGGMTAEVRAVGVGTALLSASGGPICSGTQPCPLFLVGWRLKVTVT
jgi:hypothetical protein